MWEAIGGFLTKANTAVILIIVGGILLLIGVAQAPVVLGVNLAPRNGTFAGIVVAMAIVLLLAGVAGLFLAPRATEAGLSSGPKAPAAAGPAPAEYDVFLAVPMSGTASEQEYVALRTLAMDVMGAMKRHCGIETCYFSGEKLPSKADFESQAVSAQLDFDALGRSRCFVMLYPRPVLSSVIAEAGFALARRVPTVYLVAEGTRLPFLLAEAHGLPEPAYPPVRTYTYRDPGHLLSLIRNDGARFLPLAQD
jgi:hypothetical protein